MKPTDLYSQKDLSDFKDRCIKSKFGSIFDEWLMSDISQSSVKSSIKTNFALYVFDSNIEKDDKQLEKILEKLDKL